MESSKYSGFRMWTIWTYCEDEDCFTPWEIWFELKRDAIAYAKSRMEKFSEIKEVEIRKDYITKKVLTR